MLKVGNCSKKIVFLKKKYFSLECSSERVECSSENPTDNFSPRAPKIFRSKTENSYGIIVFSKKISSKSSGHVESSFDNIAGIFCFFLKSWMFLKNTLFFFKIGQSDKFAVECVSDYFISWKCPYHLNCRFFKNYKNLTKKQYFFWEKTLSSFQKASLTKLMGGK